MDLSAYPLSTSGYWIKVLLTDCNRLNVSQHKILLYLSLVLFANHQQPLLLFVNAWNKYRKTLIL